MPPQPFDARVPEEELLRWIADQGDADRPGRGSRRRLLLLSGVRTVDDLRHMAPAILARLWGVSEGNAANSLAPFQVRQASAPRSQPAARRSRESSPTHFFDCTVRCHLRRLDATAFAQRRAVPDWERWISTVIGDHVTVQLRDVGIASLTDLQEIKEDEWARLGVSVHERTLIAHSLRQMTHSGPEVIALRWKTCLPYRAVLQSVARHLLPVHPDLDGHVTEAAAAAGTSKPAIRALLIWGVRTPEDFVEIQEEELARICGMKAIPARKLRRALVQVCCN
jgi:hypothetical protein